MSATGDDSRPVVLAELEADRLHLEQVAAVTRQWAQALGDARTAVTEAQRLRRQLGDVDFEFSDSSAEGVAKRNLDDAERSIGSVMTIADGLLRPIVDAELVRLRAEVGQLQRRLAAHCSVCGDETPSSGAADAFDLAPGKSRRCHSPASHGYCGYTPPPVLCDNPDHHDHLGDGADSIEGEGSELPGGTE